MGGIFPLSFTFLPYHIFTRSWLLASLKLSFHPISLNVWSSSLPQTSDIISTFSFQIDSSWDKSTGLPITLLAPQDLKNSTSAGSMLPVTPMMSTVQPIARSRDTAVGPAEDGATTTVTIKITITMRPNICIEVNVSLYGTKNETNIFTFMYSLSPSIPHPLSTHRPSLAFRNPSVLYQRDHTPHTSWCHLRCTWFINKQYIINNTPYTPRQIICI